MTVLDLRDAAKKTIINLHITLMRFRYLFSTQKDSKIRVMKGSLDDLNNKILIYMAVGSRIHEIPVEYCIETFKANGYKILLLLQGECDYATNEKLRCSKQFDFILARDNSGYDFGGYKELFHAAIDSRINQLSELVILNDSVHFPACDPRYFFDWLKLDRDIGAAIINYECGEPHLQSFFLQLKSTRSIKVFSNFLRNYLPLNSRMHAIRNGEIKLSGYFRDNGIYAEVFFDPLRFNGVDGNLFNLQLKSNFTHTAPLMLIKNNFPFLKWDLFSRKIIGSKMVESECPGIVREQDRERFYCYVNKLVSKPKKGFIYYVKAFFGLIH